MAVLCSLVKFSSRADRNSESSTLQKQLFINVVLNIMKLVFINSRILLRLQFTCEFNNFFQYSVFTKHRRATASDFENKTSFFSCLPLMLSCIMLKNGQTLNILRLKYVCHFKHYAWNS